jgi:preprotein translocase subunit SecE
MAMNRQQKRMLQKQGQLNADGDPVAQKRRPQQAPPKNRDARVGPVQFVREVRGELRKVAWPTRAEVIKYSIVVLVTVVLLTALIFGLDFVFGEGVLKLLKAD